MTTNNATNNVPGAGTGLQVSGTNLALVTPFAATKQVAKSFLFVRAANQNGVTGEGTQYIVQQTTVVTDRNGDWNGTSLFTAPATGYYSMGGVIELSGFAADNTVTFINITNMGGDLIFQGTLNTTAGTLAASGTVILPWSSGPLKPLTASTAYSMSVSVSGHATKNINVLGANTWMSIYIVN